MRSQTMLIVATLPVLTFGIGWLSAAGPQAPGESLDSPGPPDFTYSYTLADIYDRLNNDTAGSQSTFMEPSSGLSTGTDRYIERAAFTGVQRGYYRTSTTNIYNAFLEWFPSISSRGIGGDNRTHADYVWSVRARQVVSHCVSGFSDISAGLIGVDRSSVAWGDYDNDGDLDIILTGCAAYDESMCLSHIANVYRNDGGGSFSNVSAGLNGVARGSVAWGDYDSDNDLDILLTGCTAYDSGCTSISARIAKVYRNDGGGTFNDISAGLMGVDQSSVAWGDYDNDGDLDILLTGHNGTGYWTAVYRNDGGGTFNDISAGLINMAVGSVAWGDYDNDDDLDIILAGESYMGFITRIYRNDGGGTFSNISAGLTQVSWGASVAWGDYNNDNDLDILLAGSADGGTSRIAKVYRNDGGDTFNDISAGLTGVSWGSAVWGDYDNDGNLDILLAGDDGSSYIAKVYRNNSGDTFNDISAGLTGVYHSSVAWGDYDNDNDLDILLTGRDASNASIAKVYRNDGCPTTLSVTKHADPSPALAGSPLTYTIRVTNTGDIDQYVTITDTLPSGIVPGQTPGGTALLPGGQITWTTVITALGGTWAETLVITVQTDHTGPLTNVVHINTEEGTTIMAQCISTVEEAIGGLVATNDSPTSVGQATTLMATIVTGTNVAYTWAFGDETTGIGAVVAHTYSAAGIYTAVVTASNSINVVTATTSVTITPVIYLPLVLRRWPPIPYTPVLNSIDNADQNNYYTVAWQQADLATSYILEEATNASFSGAQVAYQGASLSWSVPAPGNMPGTYYYRVKARNTWGDSSWSNTRFAIATWAELIVNGGFESGPPASPWVQYSNFGLELIDDLGARTGSWGVYMGGLEDAVDQIYQRVTIPVTAPLPRLYYWRLIRTSDSISTVYDEMRCVIWDTSGNVLAFCGQYSNVNQSQNWIQTTYDMSAFQGQTVDIGFKAFNDELYPTQFFVDDVSLLSTSSMTAQIDEAESAQSNDMWRLTKLWKTAQRGEILRLPSLIEPISR